MMIDLPTLSTILVSAIIGYFARWLQDRGKWKREQRAKDLEVFEGRLHHLAGCMRALQWLIDDWIQQQMSLKTHGRLSLEDEEIRTGYFNMYVDHRIELENMATKVTPLAIRYPELHPDLVDFDQIYKQVHERFVVPFEQYVSALEGVGEGATEQQIRKVVKPYRRPLTDGVKAARELFDELWPKLTLTYDKIWQLKKS